MLFRNFLNENEEQKAVAIIEAIDQGEKWIFQGADGSSDFGGFIDRLFYSDGETYGTYCSCIYNGNLRLQVGFNTDMPIEICDELLALIVEARKKINSFTSIWYPPDNIALDKFLFTALPWKTQGHKTHELTFSSDKISTSIDLPKNIQIISFESGYLEAACIMLDDSLSHTFDNPNARVFFNNKEHHLQDWNEKATNGDCCLMLGNEELVGTYILKDSEIDFMAITKEKQGRGLGALLLHHAKEHIFTTKKDNPFLYCIDRNQNALRFYLREGMIVTGYSGYIFLEAIFNV